jgi:anti-sigma B factor antagonist
VIVRRETVEGTTVLRLSGIVRLGESAKTFTDALSGDLAGGEGPVLLDFAGIDTIDSTGLGEMIGYVQRYEEQGRRMAILNPRDRVLSLLRLTRLDSVIRVYHDESEALASLAPSASSPSRRPGPR